MSSTSSTRAGRISPECRAEGAMSITTAGLARPRRGPRVRVPAPCLPVTRARRANAPHGSRRGLEARIVAAQLVEREADEVLTRGQALTHEPTDDRVGLAERHTAPREVVRQVGRAEHAAL